MTPHTKQAIWNHLTCAEQTATDPATLYRIREARRLVSQDLDAIRAKRSENENPASDD